MIGAQVLIGDLPEPFLEAAIKSIGWIDYYVVVSTECASAEGERNRNICREAIPKGKLRMEAMRGESCTDFAAARNLALSMVPDGDYVLIVDSDDVHYPEFEFEAKRLIDAGHDIITAHFWHLMITKDLVQSEPHREILFRKDSSVHFEGAVHERLIHPRKNPALADTHYVHYGYVKPAEQIWERWKRYSQIESDPFHYDSLNPDEVFGERLAECKPFWREHPPVVRELLESYPSTPALPREGVASVGLILLTFDDHDLLEDCLVSLAHTRQPFELLIIECGEQVSPVGAFDAISSFEHVVAHRGASLAQALNDGFEHFCAREDIQYIGWIHPDMRFDDPRWLECLRHVLDTHPDIGKVCAANAKYPRPEHPVPGQEQCWLMRREVAERFPFDTEYKGIGGREDWDQAKRLLQEGLRVMIWPTVPVYHEGMATRSRRDTDPDGRANAALYESKWHTNDAPV
jgi:glycosyltransferase involved in cell wall biosynthesis